MDLEWPCLFNKKYKRMAAKWYFLEISKMILTYIIDLGERVPFNFAVKEGSSW